MPILAWLPSASAIPSSPMDCPAHVPVVAISTAPGLPSEESQHPTTVSDAVVGISGFAHQLATRSGSPPSIAETICQGGTFRSDGFEIKTTPFERVSFVGDLLLDTFPRTLTSA